MSVHARYLRGNLVYYDGALARLIEAIGPTALKWELRASTLQQTGTTGTDPRGYITTVVEAGIGGTSEVEASDEAGFVAEFVTDNGDNDGINLQLVGEAFQCTAGRDLYFGMAFQANDATQDDFFVGLAVGDTDVLGGVTDSLSFRKVDASTAISCVTEKDSTETTTAAVHTFVADTTVILEFYWDGTRVRYYVNGALVATHTTNIPNDEALTPTIQFLAGEAQVKRMKVAWARCIQIG